MFDHFERAGEEEPNCSEVMVAPDMSPEDVVSLVLEKVNQKWTFHLSLNFQIQNHSRQCFPCDFMNQPTRMPYSSSVLLCPLSQKIWITSPVAVFLKHGQMDFSKSSNSISHHLTSIFPENCQILGGLGGSGGWVPAWVSRPERLKGAKDEVGAQRAPNLKSRPGGPLDF